MRTISHLFIVLLLCCYSQNAFSQTERTVAQLSFEQATHNLGVIAAGQTITHTIHFTNTGEVPLLIEAVKTSCGCTTSTWPQEAIPPNKAGEIVVQFNSTGKRGQQYLGLTIVANTAPSRHILTLLAKVE